MAEYRGFDIFDILVFVLQRKKVLTIIFLSSLVISYVGIYFLIEEQYEATATIIPSDDDASGLGGMLKGLKGLPINLGKSGSSSSEVNRYNTIIFSRTTLEEIINKFNLYKVYDIDTTDKEYKEIALKRLRKEIITAETKEDAYEITARSSSAQRAADIVNFIIETLNSRMIQLKVSKSRENRLFLEKRVAEITRELHNSEDSLRKFQEASGLLDIKSQLPEVVSIYSSLEGDLISKKLKRSVLENIYDKQSSEVKNLTIEIDEYEKKLKDLKSGGERDGMLLAMKSLPQNALEYLRRFRQVEINSSILEFAIPLYEQAKLDEKKDYPVLQVIDYGVPPVKKSWPPRILFGFLGAIFVTIGYIFYLFVQTITVESLNPKVIKLRQEFTALLGIRRK